MIVNDYLRPTLLLIGLFSLLTTRCQDDSSVTEPAPSAIALAATRPASLNTFESKPSDLKLLYSQTARVGEIFTLEVMNEGQITYVHFGGSEGNCLNVFDGDGNRMRIIPDLTCDALAERVIEPGKKVYIDNWDLKECIDDVCLTREPVAPGRYLVIETFYPFPNDDSSSVSGKFPLQAEFTIQAENN